LKVSTLFLKGGVLVVDEEAIAGALDSTFGGAGEIGASASGAISS